MLKRKMRLPCVQCIRAVYYAIMTCIRGFYNSMWDLLIKVFYISVYPNDISTGSYTISYLNSVFMGDCLYCLT